MTVDNESGVYICIERERESMEKRCIMVNITVIHN